jgi:hypothetical protein
MLLNKKIVEIMDLIAQYDELRRTEDTSDDDARMIHLMSLLTHDLGSEVNAILSIPDAVALAKFGQLERNKKVQSIRIELVKRILSVKHANVLTGDRKPKTKNTFRARMKNEADVLPVNNSERLSISEFAKSGMARFFYGLVAVALWAWLVSYIHDAFVMNLGIPGWLAVIVIGGISILFYVFLMTILWRNTRNSLQALIEPKSQDAPATSAVMASYIAWALVLGITIMLAVLSADYVMHSANARVEGLKADEIARIASQNSNLSAVMSPILNGVIVQDMVGAEFGSFAGTFGDFFGGVVNPALTFGTLIALAVTILIQRTQLTEEKHRAKEATNVSNLQTFETTFFNLLNLHSSVMSGLNFSGDRVRFFKPKGVYSNTNDANEIATGRDVFTEVLDAIYHKSSTPNYRQALLGPAPKIMYARIQKGHNHALGHYFRNLYQILAFVDRYRTRLISENSAEEYTLRKRYTNILRSQLSAHELGVLFFNCTDKMVDAGEFRELLIEWEMLEHIPLVYNVKKHYLHLTGYSEYPLDHLINQYLGDVSITQHKYGAFGNNPQVAHFLEMREIFERTVACPDQG